MDFKQRLYDKYYTSHYKRFLPRTCSEWKWAVDRIHMNFGEILCAMPRDSLVLDVGCGVGYLEYYLLKNGFTRVQAIDICSEQIEVAKQKLLECKLDFEGKVKFSVENAFEHLRKNTGYDVIAIFDLLEHLTKQEVIDLLELSYFALSSSGLLIARVTNADNLMFGRFFYHDFTHEVLFTPDSMRQCLESVGFEVLKVDYEKIPDLPRARARLLGWFKSRVRHFGLAILGKFFGFSPASLSEDLIAVARK